MSGKFVSGDSAHPHSRPASPGPPERSGSTSNMPKERAVATRTEQDSLGRVEVPQDRYYGAQTQRALRNFPIGHTPMPQPIVYALARIKKAAAVENVALHLLDEATGRAIAQAADEILSGRFDDHFPLSVFQTGSGTQSHMNVNEVLARRATEILTDASSEGPVHVHPNDHVNKGQSSNDVFATALHLAAVSEVHKRLWPALSSMEKALVDAQSRYGDIVKIGRTHFQDALPLTFGLELETYRASLLSWRRWIGRSVEELYGLPFGGTAVGTGAGAPESFCYGAVRRLSADLDLRLFVLNIPSSAMASHAGLLALHGHLRGLATLLIKLSGDVRFLSSGPRTGIFELRLPENEPGSSIMPGKVNPTQAEALAMVAMHVLGNDTAIAQAESSGHLQLNVAKPLIGYKILDSIELLSDGINSFVERCLSGMEPVLERNQTHVEESLSLAAALNDELGYDRASKIARCAYEGGTTLKEAAISLGQLSAEQFDELVDPSRMARREGKQP